MTGISSGPVSQTEALAAAEELEAAIMECLNGQRKAGKLPVEPMVRLAQFARDAVAERQAHAAEIARLRLKAARYDWLRSNGHSESIYDDDWNDIKRAEEPDAAFDQAIARGTK